MSSSTQMRFTVVPSDSLITADPFQDQIEQFDMVNTKPNYTESFKDIFEINGMAPDVRQVLHDICLYQKDKAPKVIQLDNTLTLSLRTPNISSLVYGVNGPIDKLLGRTNDYLFRDRCQKALLPYYNVLQSIIQQSMYSITTDGESIRLINKRLHDFEVSKNTYMRKPLWQIMSDVCGFEYAEVSFTKPYFTWIDL